MAKVGLWNEMQQRGRKQQKANGPPRHCRQDWRRHTGWASRVCVGVRSSERLVGKEFNWILFKIRMIFFSRVGECFIYNLFFFLEIG